MNDSKNLELVKRLLNVDVDINFRPKNDELYEKYQKIRGGELTIDDLTKREIKQLTRSLIDRLKNINRDQDRYYLDLIKDIEFVREPSTRFRTTKKRIG